MANKKGIQIILAPRARLGKVFGFLAVAHRSFREGWLGLAPGRHRKYVAITSATIGDRDFGFSGGFWLNSLFGFSVHLHSFALLSIKDVLEVRDLTGKLIKRNWYCCDICWKNSGNLKNERPHDVRRSNVKFLSCPCGRTWEHEVLL